MIVIEFQPVRGPSLFAEKSCACTRISCSPNDRRWLEAGEGKARESFRAFIAATGWDITLPDESAEGDLPFLAWAARFANYYLGEAGALQGEPVFLGDPDRGEFRMAYPSLDIKFTFLAVRLALRTVSNLYPRGPDRPIPLPFQPETAATLIPELLAALLKNKKGRTSREIHDYLERVGAPWIQLQRYGIGLQLIQLGYGRYQHLINGTVSFESSVLGVEGTLHKDRTHAFLADLAFPVARQSVVMSPASAVTAAEALGYPVVLKPSYGTQGTNVHCNLRTPAEVQEAFRSIHASRATKKEEGPNPIVIEEFVEGDDFRLTVVGGKLLVTFHRVPAQVKGDGQRTVRELVEQENRNPMRGQKGQKETTCVALKLEEPELRTLRKQGLEPDSIPADGAKVLLRENANWSTGATSREVTAETHPDNAELAVRIAAAMKIDIMGVDVIADDIGKSFREGNLRVIEVNHSPGIFGTYDEQGIFHEMGGKIAEYLAPGALHSYLPIVLVFEDEHSGAVTRSIASALSAGGHTPGLVNREGFFLDGAFQARPEWIDSDDPVVPILRSLEPDAAVVERSVEGIVDKGMGTGGCDVAVTLSVSPSRRVTDVWPEGIEPGRAIGLVLGQARKGAVVCVDDPVVAAEVTKVPAERLCAVSRQGREGPVASFVARGCRAIVLDGEHDGELSATIFEPGDERSREGLRFRIRGAEAGDGEALVLLATLGVLLALDLPLEPFVEQLGNGASLETISTA